MHISKYSNLSFSSKAQGVFWMLLWSFYMTITMSLAKNIEAKTGEFSIIFFRCFFAFIFMIPFIPMTLKEIKRTKKHHLHLLRALFFCLALSCTYYAYRNLPLAEASAIGLIEPFFTTFLAIIILKEKVNFLKWIAIVGGYIGVLIIINPVYFIFNKSVFFLLFASFSASVTTICTKKLSTTDSTLLILNYTNIVSFLFFGFISFFSLKALSIRNIMLMVGIALCGVFSQISYIKALKVGNPSFLSPLEFTRFLFAIPVGMFCFSESPPFLTYFGATIVLASSYVLVRIER